MTVRKLKMKKTTSNVIRKIGLEFMDILFELFITIIAIAVFIMLAMIIHAVVNLFCSIWEESIVFAVFLLIVIPIIFYIVRKIHKEFTIKEDDDD